MVHGWTAAAWRATAASSPRPTRTGPSQRARSGPGEVNYQVEELRSTGRLAPAWPPKQVWDDHLPAPRQEPGNPLGSRLAPDGSVAASSGAGGADWRTKNVHGLRPAAGRRGQPHHPLSPGRIALALPQPGGLPELADPVDPTTSRSSARSTGGAEGVLEPLTGQAEQDGDGNRRRHRRVARQSDGQRSRFSSVCWADSHSTEENRQPLERRRLPFDNTAIRKCRSVR